MSGLYAALRDADRNLLATIENGFNTVGKGVDGLQWKPSELKPGQKLNQPSPLFKKLEESVVDEERARLGK